MGKAIHDVRDLGDMTLCVGGITPFASHGRAELGGLGNDRNRPSIVTAYKHSRRRLPRWSLVFDAGKQFFTPVKFIVQKKNLHYESAEDTLNLFLSLSGTGRAFLGSLL
jgi:hypothetical protein